MPTADTPDDQTIREKAYLLWEQDGRPDGRETEYWTRASVALTSEAQMSSLSKLPPKPKKATAEPKLKAAASKAKAAPAKTAKAAPKPTLKPKKK